MLVDLPINFHPSEKFQIGIKNCAMILDNVDINIIKQLEYDINKIGPDPEELSYWMIHDLNKQEQFVLITAALASLYTQIELRK